jgi:hypothetical protein
MSTYYGLQTGAAFMSGMAEAYNRNLLLQSDIAKYEGQMNMAKQNLQLRRDELNVEKNWREKWIGASNTRSRTVKVKDEQGNDQVYSIDPSTGQPTLIIGEPTNTPLSEILGDMEEESDDPTTSITTFGDDVLSDKQIQEAYGKRVSQLTQIGMPPSQAITSASGELEDFKKKDTGWRRVLPRDFDAKKITIGTPSDEITDYIKDLDPELKKTALDLWPKLDDVKKNKARKAIANGYSVKDVLTALQE